MNQLYFDPCLQIYLMLRTELLNMNELDSLSCILLNKLVHKNLMKVFGREIIQGYQTY